MPTLTASLCLSLWAQEATQAYEIPYDRVAERHRRKVRKVMDDVTVEVPLERVAVATRPEVYEFLLEELPFTADVCRQLGRTKYEVFRDPRKPEKDEEKEAWRHTYYMNDKEGLSVKVQLVLAEARRRIFYTWGSYDLSPLPSLWGRSVIVVLWGEKDGRLVTEAKVFAQIDSSFYKAISEVLKGTVRSVVKDKSTVFIRAARWVSEAAAENPRKLHEQLDGARDVDQVTLEEFRKKFLK